MYPEVRVAEDFFERALSHVDAGEVAARPEGDDADHLHVAADARAGIAYDYRRRVERVIRFRNPLEGELTGPEPALNRETVDDSDIGVGAESLPDCIGVSVAVRDLFQRDAAVLDEPAGQAADGVFVPAGIHRHLALFRYFRCLPLADLR